MAEPVFHGHAQIYEFNRTAPATVVLIHGINGAAVRDFGPQIAALAQRYHVLTFDLPGFGASGRENGLYSPENYVRFIHFITQQRTQRPFYLVGHSMGGAIALAYAATYPREVERLVVIDAAGVLHRVAMSRYMAREWAATTTGTAADGWVGRLAGKLVEDLGKLPFDAQRLLESDKGRRELGSATSVAGMALLEQDFGPLLPQIRTPTLLLWGRDDPIAPLRTGVALRALIAGSRLEVIDQAGHMPMWEQPEALNHALTTFLAAAQPLAAPRSLPSVAEGGGRIGLCDHEQGKRFTGAWERIELRHCTGAVIRDASVGQLSAYESRLTIEGSVLRSATTTLHLTGSELVATDVAIVGQVAVETARSSLDLAAVRLVGTEAAVKVLSESSLTFSVSTLESPQHHGPLHTFMNLPQGSGL